MIISASRRTDIPAFYSQWFIDCVKRGNVTVKNPFNSNQMKVISLLPDDVDAIVFWTRNPLPMISFCSELTAMGYAYIFLITITGYPKWLEPHSPDLSFAIETFKKISQLIGSHRVIWRYDPILFSRELTFTYHLDTFSYIANALKSYTQKVIISIMELYAKVVKRLKPLHEKGIIVRPFDNFENDEMLYFFKNLAHIAVHCGIYIQSCCSPLYSFGIPNKACIDAELLQAISGNEIKYTKDLYQRKTCLCTKSIDIGTYNTCKYGCLYCYANR